MTREEALKILDTIPTISEQVDALEMAIKALEQEPMLDKIISEIKEWQADIHDNEYDAETYDFVFERIYEILDKYKVESEGV